MLCLHTWQSHRSVGGPALKKKPSAAVYCVLWFGKELGKMSPIFCCNPALPLVLLHILPTDLLCHNVLERDPCPWLSHPLVITSSSLLLCSLLHQKDGQKVIFFCCNFTSQLMLPHILLPQNLLCHNVRTGSMPLAVTCFCHRISSRLSLV